MAVSVVVEAKRSDHISIRLAAPKSVTLQHFSEVGPAVSEAQQPNAEILPKEELAQQSAREVVKASSGSSEFKATTSPSQVSERRAHAPPELVSGAAALASELHKLCSGARPPGSVQRCKVPAALAPADDVKVDGHDATQRAAATATPGSKSEKLEKPDINTLASAVAASKLGLVDQLSQALASCAAVAFAKDAEDRTCLHYAAGYGHEECVSLLLEARADTRLRDANGDLPLHFAAIHGHPMCAYNITKASPAACLTRNFRGQTPVEVAVACERGEVLNAMLLACAGDGTAGTTVQAMRKLLASGAVPDTWAPNGSSALMLAAAANGCEALRLLLEAGASLELQDALGRSALMFAAGNCAVDTLLALLDSGACISQRDRRGRNVLDYAPAGSEVRRLLQARLDELEAVANKRQEALLASLLAGEPSAAAAGSGGGEGKAASGGKKKKAAKKAATKAAAAAGGNDAGKAAAKAAPCTAASCDVSPAAAAAADDADVAAAASERAAFSGAASPEASPRAQKAAASAAAQPSTSAAASAAGPSSTGAVLYDTWALADGGDSDWKTVSSKCTGKQRQQQPSHQPHIMVASSSNGVATSSHPHGHAGAARPPAPSGVAKLADAARSAAPQQQQLPVRVRLAPAKSQAASSAAAQLSESAAGFKAALLGSGDASSSSSCQSTGPSADREAAGSAAGCGGERKPAWGGAKPCLQTAAIAAAATSTAAAIPVAVAGCNSRAYPPLAAAANAGGQGSRAQARQPHATAAQPAQQQQQASLVGSYTASSSMAAASVPASVASIGESETSTGTGHSTCSNPDDGASSPRSFGHDWTRPSPVDVLQAALAASASAANGGGADDKLTQSCRSKSCSSSGTLSYDGACDGGQGADAAAAAGVYGAAVPAHLSGLSLSLLGGTEVPPPARRSSGGVDGCGGAAAGLDLLGLTAVQGGVPCTAAAVANGCGSRSGGGAAAAAGKAARSSGSYLSEIARLKTEAESLQSRLRQVEQRHAQELAAVLVDAEAHEAAAVESALAQERLRITANLLAIGLCPEAILAVITPPGHGLDAEHLLAATLAADCAAAAAAVTTTALPATAVSTVSAAALAAGLGGSGAACGGSDAGRVRLSAPANAAANAGACGSAAAAAASSSVAVAVRSAGRRRSTATGRGAYCSSTGRSLSGGTDPWDDGRPAGGSSAGAKQSAADSAAFGLVRCPAEPEGRPFGSLVSDSSQAVAIPSASAAATGGAASMVAAAVLPSLGSAPSAASHFGSPATHGLPLCGSFGSGGVVSSLCAGLGLGLLADVRPGSCGAASGAGGSGPGSLATRSGVGLGLLASAAVAAEDDEEEEDLEMDLPACGDISALLAMSDDDDA